MALKDRIPGVEWIHWERNISRSRYAEGWTEACFMLFADEAARDAYLTHPEHLKVSQTSKEFSTDIVVFDSIDPFNASLL